MGLKKSLIKLKVRTGLKKKLKNHQKEIDKITEVLEEMMTKTTDEEDKLIMALLISNLLSVFTIKERKEINEMTEQMLKAIE